MPVDQAEDSPAKKPTKQAQNDLALDRGKFMEAIWAVRAEVPRLTKNATNAHGGYNFVSIDRYYEEVAGKAFEKGLTWTLDEVVLGDAIANLQPHDVGPVHGGGYPPGGGAAPAKPQVSTTKIYTIHLMLRTGEMWPDFRMITVHAPYVGAQTSGILESYAEKQAMRSLFKLPTGEPDADALPPDSEIKNTTGAIFGKSADPFAGL